MNNENMPELPYWTKMDNLGGLVPSAIRQSVTAYGQACYNAGRAAAIPAGMMLVPESYQAKPTDISAQLREFAGNNGYSHGDYADVMRRAADECERFYGGMVAWKETAKEKDRFWNLHVNEIVAKRLAASTSQPAVKPVPECLGMLTVCPTCQNDISKCVQGKPVQVRNKLIPMQNDEGQRGWYFDSDEFYVDIDREVDGTYSVYFKNRKEGTHELFVQYAEPVQGSIGDDAEFKRLLDQVLISYIDLDKCQGFMQTKAKYDADLSAFIAYIDSRQPVAVCDRHCIDFCNKHEEAVAASAKDAEDAARLDFVLNQECAIESLPLKSGTRYRVFWPEHEEGQVNWYKTPREAIDAAIAATKAAK